MTMQSLSHAACSCTKTKRVSSTRVAAHSGQSSPWMMPTKFGRSKRGQKRSSASAFTLPIVVCGRCSLPSVNACRILSLEVGSRVRVRDLRDESPRDPCSRCRARPPGRQAYRATRGRATLAPRRPQMRRERRAGTAARRSRSRPRSAGVQTLSAPRSERKDAPGVLVARSLVASRTNLVASDFSRVSGISTPTMTFGHCMSTCTPYCSCSTPFRRFMLPAAPASPRRAPTCRLSCWPECALVAHRPLGTRYE